MSLTDAMLLEGYRDPKEVYIALRTDGLKGSGTIDDPYDGGTTTGSLLSGKLTFNSKEFVVGTPFPHNLDPMNLGQVTIENVKGPGAAWFNITATVQQVLSPLHFTVLVTNAQPPPAPPNVPRSGAFYSVTLPGNTTPTSPARIYWPIAKIDVSGSSVPHDLSLFDAVNLSGQSIPSAYSGASLIFGPSPDGIFAFRLKDLASLPGNTTSEIDCNVQRYIHRFDAVMRAIPKYSLIHVGPGEFETRGYASIYVSDPNNFSLLHCGFILREGQRLFGSGMGATTIKLVFPLDEINQTSAIGNPSSPHASYSAVGDLTADANASGHGAYYGVFPAPVTCGNVTIGGSFLRMNRVRAIGFCTQAHAECFSLSLGSTSEVPAPVFNVLENCVLERPGENNTHESTLLKSNGNHYAAGRSPVVRHSFADCWYVGRNASSAYVAIASITQDATDKGKFTLETKTPHFRDVGNNVHLSGVTSADAINASFRVEALDTLDPAKKLVFRFFGNADSYTNINATEAYLGVDFHGPIPGNATGAVVEGNALFDCAQGIYQDTGISQDVVIRDNYFSNCQRGLNLNLGTEGGTNGAQLARTGVNLESLTRSGSTATAISQAAHGLKAGGETVAISGVRVNNGDMAAAAPYNGDHFATPDVTDPKKFTYTVTGTPPAPDAPTPTTPIRVGVYSLTRDSDPTIAILETAQPHQLKAGDVVIIQAATMGGGDDPPAESYNDITNVLSVVSTTKFKYQMKNDPEGEADASTTFRTILYSALRQVRHLIFESNFCDLQTFDFNTGVSPDARPRGLQTIAFKGPPYIFPAAIIRGNFIRHIDDVPPVVEASGNNLYALRIGSFRNTLIEHNVIGMTTPGLIHYTNGEAVTGFNNRTTQGALLPLYADTAGDSDVFEQRFDGLEGRISDAILMSLL